MTAEEAAEFICRHCNVGRNPEELLNTKPTAEQLRAARNYVECKIEAAFLAIKEWHEVEV